MAKRMTGGNGNDEARSTTRALRGTNWAATLAGLVLAIGGLVVVIVALNEHYPNRRLPFEPYIATLAAGVALTLLGIIAVQRGTVDQKRAMEELVQELARFNQGRVGYRALGAGEGEEKRSAPRAQHGPVDQPGGDPVPHEGL